MESRFFLSEGPEGTPIWHEPPRCCFLIVKSTILYRQNHRALLFSEKPPKIHKNDPGMARPNTEGLPKVCPTSAQRLPQLLRPPIHPQPANPYCTATHAQGVPKVYRNSFAPQPTHIPSILTARQLPTECSFFSGEEKLLATFFFSPDRGDYRSRKPEEVSI